MEANLVISVSDLSEEFAKGLVQVFSKDALLNITVHYEPGNLKKESIKGTAGLTKSGLPAKKRGRKPKPVEPGSETIVPKKRGRKPKIATA